MGGRRFPPRPSSVRTRLVGIFAVGSSVLVLLTGALLYIGFNAQLDGAIDQALRDRADDIALDLREGNQQIRPGEPFVVLLDLDGHVIEATTNIEDRPVLTARELSRASTRELVLERRRVTGLGTRGRLLARPELVLGGRTIVLVVGESLDTVFRARQRLGLLLVAASPLLIGVVAGCGWVLVGAALRPVRRMTEEAASISPRESGQRLPEPPGQDELALLGHTLNAMLDRIEASIAHERAFIDDASHELRTPLSILRGELELAASEPNVRVAVRRALQSSLQEADHLGRLTEDLLVLARADSGRLPPSAEAVDLLDAARRVAAARDPGSGLATEVSGQPVEVRSDPVLIERIVRNLVDNASRHAVRRIGVDVGVDGASAVLTVADDGSGFPAEFLPVALDRFTRADGVRRRGDGGSGLGLAIVAALVRDQGGRVEVGNGEPLGGGRVRVWLPVASTPA